MDGSVIFILTAPGTFIVLSKLWYVRNVKHISNKSIILCTSRYILPVVNNLSPQERQRFFIGPVEGEPELSCDLMLDPEPGRVLVPDFKDEASLSEGKDLGE